MGDESGMRQEAPYPTALSELVHVLRYKDGWTFTLNDITRGQGSLGLTLIINVKTRDSYHPDQWITVQHLMPVPPAAYDWRSWRRWLFEQIMLVEQHEAMEFFALVTYRTAGRTTDPATGNERVDVDAVIDRPYAPSHGPGNDPYLVREVSTDTDRRTSSRGVLQQDGRG